MTRLILVRHGETDWNLEGRWQGQSDVPLNHRGLEQAAHLAHDLARDYPIDAIYTSDLSRARRTAEAIAVETGRPVHVDSRLRESNLGEWEGLPIHIIQDKYKDLFHRRLLDPWTVAPPGGETASEVRRRVAAALADIAARYPSQTVVVVTHGFVLAVAQTIHRGEAVERIWDLLPDHVAPVIVEWLAPKDQGGPIEVDSSPA
jgi:broad specificity phosphatase PhoE